MKNILRRRKSRQQKTAVEYFRFAVFALFFAIALIFVAHEIENTTLKWVGVLLAIWYFIDMMGDFITIAHQGGSRLYLQFFKRNKR
ncbi:TPA: hypothetical protein EYO12_01295 [Candidatus Saccharibacteria bacterium]|nr:hypothetical protein [Candidatus Saccharibacteria bacterium]HIO87354.1 hypothetical protein [Candidatus Saccharibacteria bacterium]